MNRPAKNSIAACNIAKIAGFEVPAYTKILIGEVESVELSEAFAHEKLSPVLAMYRATNFADALSKAERLVADGGYGHTSSVYLDPITQTGKLADFQARMKTCRILVNTPSAQGGIGAETKLFPALTLGCGAVGGSSSSNNISPMDLINIRRVAWGTENIPAPQCPQDDLVEIITAKILERLK